MKITTPAQKVTIDELAVMVKRGFDEMDRRFNEMHDEMNGRFKEVDGKFVKIDGRFAMIDGHFKRIDSRLDRLEGDVAEIKQTLPTLATKEDVNRVLVNHEKRLHKVEVKLQIA